MFYDTNALALDVQSHSAVLLTPKAWISKITMVQKIPTHNAYISSLT